MECETRTQQQVFRRDLLGGGQKMSPGALPTKSGVTTVTVTESSFSRTGRLGAMWRSSAYFFYFL